MKVSKLLELISDTPDAEIEAFDDRAGRYIPITTVVFDSNKNAILLQTGVEDRHIRSTN